MTDISAPSSAPAATTPSAPSSSSAPASASTTPDNKSSTSAPSAPSESKGTESTGASSPAAEQIRKLKVKIDNEEHELDESEVVKGYQNARAADKRYKEAAKMRQQAERFIDALQKDPISILQNPALGVNFREIAEKYLLDQIQDEMLSPEEKKTRAEQEELRKYREQENTHLGLFY